MKYCSKCQVSVDNPVDRCPLCFTTLTPKDDLPERDSYPDIIQQANRYNLLIRVLLLLSLTVCGVCLTVNLLVDRSFLWSLIVVGNVLYMWVAISTAVKRRYKVGFNILVQAISLAAILVLIDWIAGHNNWALNFVVPFLFITATLSITIIIVVKRMNARNFILYFFLIALLGFIPIILLAFRQVDVLWPSLVSALYSAFSLVSLFVFAFRATKLELKKRFHI